MTRPGVHQARLTALWCDEFRLHKLAEYKKSLDQKQPGFLREKAEKYRYGGRRNLLLRVIELNATPLHNFSPVPIRRHGSINPHTSII